MAVSLEHITANLAGTVRRETFNGREHIVVPLSMIVPGILNGSNGPLLYEQAELSKDPSRWNGFPIMLGHPEQGGRPVSARDPGVLNGRQMGHVFRSAFDGHKLKAEGWFDMERTRQISPEVMNDLSNGRPMELSTGLFADYDMTPGTYNGQSYVGRVLNLRPDHLAILLHERGACSLKDGCGVLVNMSYDDIRRELSTQLKGERFGLPDGDDRYIEEVYQDSFVYQKDGKFWRLEYALRDKVVTILDGTPREVQLRREYTFVGDEPNVGQVVEPPGDVSVSSIETKEPDMATKNEAERKSLVDSLIKNCDCYDEGDREVLNKLSDDRLVKLNEHVNLHRKLVANAAKADELIANAAKEGAKGLKKSEHKDDPPVANQEPVNPKTMDDWLKEAPVEVQGVVRNAMAAELKQKEFLVERITANERNTFTKEHLLMKDVQELEAIAVLAEVSQPKSPALYIGATGGAVANRGKQDEEEALALPTINWAEKTA